MLYQTLDNQNEIAVLIYVSGKWITAFTISMEVVFEYQTTHQASILSMLKQLAQVEYNRLTVCSKKPQW